MDFASIDRLLNTTFDIKFARNVQNINTLANNLNGADSDSCPSAAVVSSSSSAVLDAEPTEPVSFFDGAILDMALVQNVFQLRMAVMRALLNKEQGKMKTKALSSEIMYQLSPTTKISEAIKQLKLKSTTEIIAIVSIATENIGEKSAKSVLSILPDIQGEFFTEDRFEEVVSESLQPAEERTLQIIKAFKVNKLELDTFPLEEIILNKLAMKDYV